MGVIEQCFEFPLHCFSKNPRYIFVGNLWASLKVDVEESNVLGAGSRTPISNTPKSDNQ